MRYYLKATYPGIVYLYENKTIEESMLSDEKKKKGRALSKSEVDKIKTEAKAKREEAKQEKIKDLKRQGYANDEAIKKALRSTNQSKKVERKIGRWDEHTLLDKKTSDQDRETTAIRKKMKKEEEAELTQHFIELYYMTLEQDHRITYYYEHEKDAVKHHVHAKDISDVKKDDAKKYFQEVVKKSELTRLKNSIDPTTGKIMKHHRALEVYRKEMASQGKTRIEREKLVKEKEKEEKMA